MRNPYNKYVVPRLVEWVCGSTNFDGERQKVVPQAKGTVLEVGLGTGHNLPFYDPEKVKKLYGLEPSKLALKYAKERIGKLPFEVNTINGSAASIGLPNESIDSIVMTFTLCSIGKLNESLTEMNRVLKPGGSVYFCEHGIAPERRVKIFQNAINPVWRFFSGGCNLNRKIPELLSSKFDIQEIDEDYAGGWKFGSYHYWGEAVKK